MLFGVPCYVVLCSVLRTHINAQHRLPHAPKAQKTTEGKKRKHINHPDAERRR